MGSVTGTGVSPSHSSHVRQGQRSLQNPRSSGRMARPSLTLPTLLMSLKLITEHVSFGLLSAAECPHCCTCTREFQTSCFLHCVEQGAPRQPWQGLEEPQHHFPANTMAGRSRGDHTGQPVRGLPGESLCFARPRWEPALSAPEPLTPAPDGDCVQTGHGRWFAHWLEVLVEVCVLSQHPAAPCGTQSPSAPHLVPPTEICLLLKSHLPCLW